MEKHSFWAGVWLGTFVVALVWLSVTMLTQERSMKLFLIEQYENMDYSTYDSAVVAAPDEAAARYMHPKTGKPVDDWIAGGLSWCSGPEHVAVRYLGEAADGVEQGVVCASYNAP